MLKMSANLVPSEPSTGWMTGAGSAGGENQCKTAGLATMWFLKVGYPPVSSNMACWKRDHNRI